VPTHTLPAQPLVVIVRRAARPRRTGSRLWRISSVMVPHLDGLHFDGPDVCDGYRMPARAELPTGFRVEDQPEEGCGASSGIPSVCSL
jgi:hypothetical protein